MRYLQYLASAVVVGGGLYLLLSIAFDSAYAAKMAAVTAPLALWTGRDSWSDSHYEQPFPRPVSSAR